jgi:hypothetical protein
MPGLSSGWLKEKEKKGRNKGKRGITSSGWPRTDALRVQIGPPCTRNWRSCETVQSIDDEGYAVPRQTLFGETMVLLDWPLCNFLGYSRDELRGQTKC